MLTITLRFFASLSDHFGSSPIRRAVPTPATVSTIRDSLGSEKPAAHPALAGAKAAINGRFSADDTPLKDGDELAFLPPMSGG